MKKSRGRREIQTKTIGSAAALVAAFLFLGLDRPLGQLLANTHEQK